MTMNKTLFVLGYASDVAGGGPGSAKGPSVLQQSSYLAALHEQGLNLHWQSMITAHKPFKSSLTQVGELCNELARDVAQLVQKKQFFLVLGGDHTSAIGTWSGASVVKKNQGPLGLIWIDAHMDSHTPQTTLSGNMHGMPLACLLGHGENRLTHLAGNAPKLHPEYVCLIGVRSYEEHEAQLLNQLNVRVFYKDEIKQRGLVAVLRDAIQIVTNHTAGYGISIDIDSIDPKEAPGTGVTEPGGLSANELCHALTLFVDDARLIGVEIAEFDPSRDSAQMTEKLIAKIITAFTKGDA